MATTDDELDDTGKITKQISITTGDIRDSIVNIAGGDIIQSNVTYEFASSDSGPIPVRSLESVLRRYEDLAPTFFRPTGLTWTDLENEFHPYSDNSVADILQGLEAYRYHLLLGSSTAWREQLARFAGWKLSNLGARVLFTDCWHWPSNPVLAIDWSTVDLPQTVLIIENAHVRPSTVEDFFDLIRDRTENLAVLISSEPALTSLLSQRPYFQTDLLSIPTTTVRAADFESQLIHRYAEKVLRRRVTRRTLVKLGLDSGEGNLGLFFRAEENSDPNPNLWLLSAILDAWDGRELGDNKEKQEILASFVARRVFRPIELTSPQQGSLLIAIAFLSYYGVSVTREFLVNKLAYDSNAIDALVRHGLFNLSARGIKLADYNLSALLIRVTYERSEIYIDLRKRLGSDRLGNALIQKVLAFGAADYDVLLLNSIALPSPELRFWDPMAIYPSDLRDDFLERCIENHLKGDFRAGHIGRALIGAQRAGLKLLRFREVFPVERLTILAESKDAAVKECAWLVLGVHRVDEALAQELMRSVSLDLLAQKANAEVHIGKIASLLWAINNADHEVGVTVARLLEKESLLGRLNHEANVTRIGWLLEVAAATDAELARRLSDGLDLSSLKERIDTETSNRQLAALLWGLSLCSSAQASSVAAVVSDNALHSRVAEEDDPWVLGLLLRALGHADSERSKALIESFDDEFFLKIATTEEDLNSLGMLFSGITTANPEYGDSLVSRTVKNLDSEAGHQRAMEHMFSTMNPTAMAMAGHAARRAERRSKVVSSFSSFYPPERFLTAVSDLGRKSSEDSKRAELEESSWEVFLEGTSKLPSEIIWRAYLYQHEYCSNLLQGEVWNAVAKGCVLERSFERKCKLAIALQSANPSRFAALLLDNRPVSVASFSMSDLSKGLSLSVNHKSEAGFLLYSALTARNGPSIEKLLRSAPLHYLNNMLWVLSSHNETLAKEILVHASAGAIERLLEKASEWEIEAFAGLVYQTAPEEVAKIPEGAFQVYENGEHRSVSSVRGDLAAICEVLDQLNSRWLFDADINIDDRGRLQFARALEAMGIVSAIEHENDLELIDQCLSSVNERDGLTGRALVASLDHNALVGKIRRAKDSSRWFFRSLAQANAAVTSELLDEILDTARRIGSTDSIAIIGQVYAGNPTLGAKLLRNTTNRELRQWSLRGKNIEDVAKAFSIIAEFDPMRAKASVDRRTIAKLKKMILKEDHLWTVLRSLTNFADIDLDVAKVLAVEISERALEKTLERSGLGLITGVSADRDSIADLARLAPERVMKCADILISKIYELDPDGYPGLESGKQLFEQLRQKAPQVWRHLFHRLNVTQLVNLISIRDPQHASWRDYYLRGFFEELYLGDSMLAREVQAQCPDRISKEWLYEIDQDSPRTS